jgi:hypothetical protein
MRSRNRTWSLAVDALERDRQRILPIEGGDGSTLTLDFTTGVLDPRLTFTRTTDATFINSSGLVQYADANYLAQSETLSGTPWSTNGVSNTSVAVTNPVGGSDSRLISVTASGGSKSHVASVSVASGFQYTVRIWMRAGNSTSAAFGFLLGSFVTVTPSIVSGPGSVSGTTVCTVTGLTSAWTQVQMVLATTTSAGTGGIYIYPNAIANSIGDSIHLWGAQMNIGNTADPYYTTTANPYYAPRFDHDPTTPAPKGLLIEGAANNFAANSNLQAAWLGGSNTTVTANTNEVTSPDGTNNAAKIALTNTGYCSRFESITGLANATTYTFSYWIRGTAGNQQRVYSVTQGTDLVTQSNLTYTSTGWTRVQITFTSGAVNNNVYVYVASRPTGTVNDVLYVYGCQLETGNGASSLIPTGASTGNRQQDLVSITLTSFSSWWTSNNPASFLVDISSTNRPLANHIFRIADSSGSAYGYQSYFNSTTMPMQVRAAMSSTASSDISIGSSLAANTRTKIGFTVETASLKRFRDGSLANTLTTPTLPPNTLTQMYIGGTSSFGNSSADFHIRQFKYWPITLSDAAMQGFTT